MEKNAVVIPQLTVNDEYATVEELPVGNGTRVEAGMIVLTVSTSKASFEIQSEHHGYFWSLVERGDRVAVGDVAALVSAAPDMPEECRKVKDAEASTANEIRATKAARDLADRHGIDLAQLAKRGMIRTRDVEELIERQAATSGAREQATDGRGTVNAEFLTAIQRGDSGFLALSSELKLLLYRANGAVIGENVVFAPGSGIFASSIVVGDGCEFGADTVIRAESVRIGKRCLFGTNNDIMCRRIEIGDLLFLANRVLIGQGGAFNDEAYLRIGHSCLISSDVLINTAHRVTIGDISCLSPGVSIYTHSHWQSVLDGYQATFAPVRLGDNVWVTGNCLIAPGAEMEDGSQALANSTVVGRVPARTIVSGVPAKPVHTVRSELSLAERDGIMRRLWPKVEHALQAAGLSASDAEYAGQAPRAESSAPVQVAFGAAPAGYAGVYFDLENRAVTGAMSRAAAEVRNVLRKHGIRFAPHDWRYRADVGKFNA